MRMVTRLNPTGGVKDFWHEFTRPNPYRWPILGLSVLATFCLLFWVTQERVYVPPPRPQVSYITTFAPGRTDAEIVASNIANQQRKERLAAEQAEREERVKEMYRQLGRATGIDVEAMEREIAAEEARQRAAAEGDERVERPGQ